MRALQKGGLKGFDSAMANLAKLKGIGTSTASGELNWICRSPHITLSVCVCRYLAISLPISTVSLTIILVASRLVIHSGQLFFFAAKLNWFVCRVLWIIFRLSAISRSNLTSMPTLFERETNLFFCLLLLRFCARVCGLCSRFLVFAIHLFIRAGYLKKTRARMHAEGYG